MVVESGAAARGDRFDQACRRGQARLSGTRGGAQCFQRAPKAEPHSGDGRTARGGEGSEPRTCGEPQRGRSSVCAPQPRGRSAPEGPPEPPPKTVGFGESSAALQTAWGTAQPFPDRAQRQRATQPAVCGRWANLARAERAPHIRAGFIYSFCEAESAAADVGQRGRSFRRCALGAVAADEALASWHEGAKLTATPARAWPSKPLLLWRWQLRISRGFPLCVGLNVSARKPLRGFQAGFAAPILSVNEKKPG